MFTARVTVLLLLGCFASSAFAGTDARVEELGISEGLAAPITLDEAIDMALTNNLDARVDRVGVQIARDRVHYAAGAFDATFSISASRDSTQTPQNATNIVNAAELQQVTIAQQTLDTERQLVLANQELAIQIAQANGVAPPVFTQTPTPTTLTNFATVPPLIFDTESSRLASQLQGKTPLGTTYTFGLQAAHSTPRIEGVDRQFVTEDTAVASVSVQQPLLRDFGPAANLAEIRISRQNQKLATLTWQQTTMNAVQTVITTYYDMVFALENVRVRQEAITADQRLVQGNQRRLDVGIMSPIDVRQAQVQMSEDQETLITAKNFFMERQFALKRAVLHDADASDPHVFMPATNTPPTLPPLDPVEWKRTAFENRLDYKSAVAQAVTEDIRLRFARNQMLPKLDLVASYGLNGLATGFGSGLSRAFDSQARQWSVGVVASVPIFNIQGRAQLAIAKGFKEQALLKIKQTELTIDVDVDTIISRIKTNIQRVETARQSRRFGEEAMKIQNKRLDEGQVSSFDIIDTQKKLYEARTRELAAKAELDKSIVQLWFSTGTLFDKEHIVVEEPIKQAHAR